MSFTINLITQRAGGGNIVRTKTIMGAQAVIGRGADCDIQLPDLAVSLRHAVMRQTGRGEVEVEAIGRMSFEANGAFVSHARLRLSDKPKLGFGNHELVLSRGAGPDDAIVTISRREDTQAQIAESDARKVFALSTAMFSRRWAAWVLMTALLALCLALPVGYFYLNRGAPLAATTIVPRADAQWESGSLSPGHRFLEKNCQACHQKAFVSVRDDACLACHKPGLDKMASLQLAAQMREAGSKFIADPAPDHAPAARMLKAEPMSGSLGHEIHAAIARTFDHPEGRCASCHTEHVDSAKTKIANTSPQVTAAEVIENDCANCHRDLKSRLPDTALLNVADWADHPDFRPLLTVNAKGPVLARIPLADHPLDNNGLIFPHVTHLSKTGGVARMAIVLGSARGYGGPLECANCHRADGGGFKPIEMVRDCAACHSLAFAHEGGKVMMLPHGHPDQVVAVLTSFYESGASADMSDLFRRRPGYENVPPMPASGDAVARGVRAVFSKGGACYGCHTIIPPSNPKSLNFDIAPVHLENRFLPRGGFDHSVPAHRLDANGNPNCESCHASRSSTRSADLLLPPIAKCAVCHGQPKLVTAQAASSDCTECHGYHNPGMPAAYTPVAWDAKP